MTDPKSPIEGVEKTPSPQEDRKGIPPTEAPATTAAPGPPLPGSVPASVPAPVTPKEAVPALTAASPKRDIPAAAAPQQIAAAPRQVLEVPATAPVPRTAGTPPAPPSERKGEGPLAASPALAGEIPAVAKAAVRIRTVVPKHHALVRLSHWMNVPILMALIATGLSIYWASPVFDHAPSPSTGSRDYFADAGIWIAHTFPSIAGKGTPAAWVYDRFGIGVFRLAQALRLHWLFAYFFMANGALYLLGLLFGRGYKALLPRSSDPKDAFAMMRYYAGVIPAKLARRPWPHPPVRSKYNALQRGAYFSMPILGALAVASGWAMHKPVQLHWLERLFVNYNGARIVHFGVMIALAAFVIPHVVLVAADGWDTFRSMIVGWSERIGGTHGKD